MRERQSKGFRGFAHRLAGRDPSLWSRICPKPDNAQVGRTRQLLRGTRKPGESGDVSGPGARALVADYSPTEPETPGLLTRSSSWLNDGFLNRERTTPFLTDEGDPHEAGTQAKTDRQDARMVLRLLLENRFRASALTERSELI